MPLMLAVVMPAQTAASQVPSVLSPPAAQCKVSALNAVTGAALEFELGAGVPPPWSLADIDEDLDKLVVTFSDEMRKQGVRVERTSGFRPVEYQEHLREISDKWDALQHQYEHDARQREACTFVQVMVDAEIKKHRLKVLDAETRSPQGVVIMRKGRPLVSKAAKSAHQARPKSRAVDLSITPWSKTVRTAALKLGLAQPCVKDVVHFTSPKVGCDFTVEAKASSPVRLFLIDPAGRKIGFDPERRAVVNEIGPDADYSDGRDGIETIVVAAAPVGRYQVGGVGTGDGRYSISVVTLDEGANVHQAVAWSGLLRDGQALPLRSVPALRPSPTRPDGDKTGDAAREAAAPPAADPGGSPTPPQDPTPTGPTTRRTETPVDWRVLVGILLGAAVILAGYGLSRWRR